MIHEYTYWFQALIYARKAIKMLIIPQIVILFTYLNNMQQSINGIVISAQIFATYNIHHMQGSKQPIPSIIIHRDGLRVADEFLKREMNSRIHCTSEREKPN